VASKQPGASAEEIYIGEEKTEDLNHLTSQFILRRTQVFYDYFSQKNYSLNKLKLFSCITGYNQQISSSKS
jgi:hypothetical protein